MTMDKEHLFTEAQILILKAHAQKRCSATTRKGTPCKRKVIRGKNRCRNHGGLSTGPKTAEGRKAISEASKKRWSKWRKEQEAIKHERMEARRLKKRKPRRARPSKLEVALQRETERELLDA